MIADTTKRLDRIVAILIQLQSKKIIKAKEIANRFDISERTVYRDIKTLEAAGVPIIGEAGQGYSLMSGYRLPPVMFTQPEAISFIAAAQLMQEFTDENLFKDFSNALMKIKAILRFEEKNMVENLDEVIAVKNQVTTFNLALPNVMQIIIPSISEQQQVSIFYEGAKDEKPIWRTIEPLGIFLENNYWYILAYCKLRKDYRQFRIDRIQQIKTLEKGFDTQHSLNLAEFQTQKSILQTKTHEVVLQVKNEWVKYMQHDFHQFGFVKKETQESLSNLHFHVAIENNYFVRWLLMFADQATIIKAPEAMKSKIYELLKAAMLQFKN